MLKNNIVQRFKDDISSQESLFSSIKNTAFNSFLKNGFPKKHEEDWRYINLRSHLKENYKLDLEEGLVKAKDIEKISLQNLDSHRIELINGKLLSKPKIPGVQIYTLEEAKKKYPQIVLENLQKASSHSFIDINTALVKKGIFILVQKNTIVEKPIEIICCGNAKESSFDQYRNMILLESGANIKFVEHIHSLSNEKSFVNAVSQFKIERNAIMEYNKLQANSGKMALLDNVYIHQDESSTCTLNTFLLDGDFTRNDLSFFQEGENCESNMNSVIVLENNQFGDNHTFINHAEPNCKSNELYKGVYLDNAKGVFNGKIMVRPDAQKINAFQANNNLVLGKGASINTKPQLEIFADDVKCSHGCTIGSINQEALFYMRSRGINKEDAKAFLTYAFATEVFEKITIPELKSHVENTFNKKLKTEITLNV